MMSKFTLILILALAPALASQSWAKSKEKADDGDRSCLSFDAAESEESWPLFESSVPACKRAMVTMERDTKLDLGEKIESHVFKTGMTAFKAKVVTGKGHYTDDDRGEDVAGVTMWVSVDRCEMRDLVFIGANGKDVSSLKDARYVLTTDDLSAMANTDDLKGAKNDCPKK